MTRAQPLNGRAPCVFVVEDDAAVRDVILTFLADEGYTVRGAANGFEALALLAEGEEPSALLLDLSMPGLDGRGLVAALQQRGLAPPICLMSGSDNQGPLAAELGAAAFLNKPFALDDLLRVVVSLCAAAPTV